MLRFCAILRGVSPFTVFLMDQKNNPALKGCAIAKRGKILSKMYKELSQHERKDLLQRAARHPTIPKVTRTERLKAAQRARKRSKGEFAIFVRDNFHKVKALNHRRRFAALSQLYELSKPIDLVKEAAKVQQKSKSTRKGTAKKAKTAVNALKSNAAAEKPRRGRPPNARQKIKKAASTLRK